MPLARQALHVSGEDVHVAVFPTIHETYQIASRHYTSEGRCFVPAAGLMKAADLPAALLSGTDLSKLPENILRGGSGIIAPDSSLCSSNQYSMKENLLPEGNKMQKANHYYLVGRVFPNEN